MHACCANVPADLKVIAEFLSFATGLHLQAKHHPESSLQQIFSFFRGVRLLLAS
jgi:hypothetical protein